MSVAETYQRVCTLAAGHEGDHLPYYLAPAKDEFGNKEIAFPNRCVHVVPVPTGEREEQYRVVFEMVDPRMPRAGWHEVCREGITLDDARDQLRGLRELEASGDDVRDARIEKASLRWERIEDEGDLPSVEDVQGILARPHRPVRDNPQA